MSTQLDELSKVMSKNHQPVHFLVGFTPPALLCVGTEPLMNPRTVSLPDLVSEKYLGLSGVGGGYTLVTAYKLRTACMEVAQNGKLSIQ